MDKGTEIYLECLDHMKKEKLKRITSNVPIVPPYLPQYAHNSAPLYMPDQYWPQSAQMRHFPCAPSAFNPASGWSLQHEAQLNPLNAFNSPYYSQHLQYDYLDKYDQNMGYGLKVSPTSSHTPYSVLSSEDVYQQRPHHNEQSGSALITNNENHLSDAYPKSQQNPPTSDFESTFDSTDPSSHDESSTVDADKPPKKIPRPMNSFMIYAKQHRSQVHKLYPMCDNRTISKILSETWYNMEPDKKKKYHELAIEMRAEHSRLYPNYKWKAASNGSVKTAPATPITDDSMSPISTGDAARMVDQSAERLPKFRLGPTPAQLGLCRNKIQPNVTVSTEAMVTSDTSNVQMNSRKSDTNQNVNSVGPRWMKRFQELPQFDFNTYRLTNDWDASPTPPAITYNTQNRKRSMAKQSTDEKRPKRIVAERFFGPDFNIKQFTDIKVNSLSSSPATPSPSNHQLLTENRKKRQLIKERKSVISGLFQECGFFPSANQIEDLLKHHIDLFDSKTYLIAKIREYRQKQMQNQSPKELQLSSIPIHLDT